MHRNLFLTRTKMITDISISNFKSIKEIKNLKLKPLTIFAGENSSGKSNIMEAISFFGQASRWQKTRESFISLRGVLRYGDVKTYPPQMENFIVFKRQRRKKVELSINLRPDTYLNQYFAVLSDKASEYVLPDKTTEIESVGYSISFRLSDSFFSQKILINGNRVLEAHHVKGQKPVIVYPEDFHNINTRHSLDSVLNEMVFSPSKSHPVFDNISRIAAQIVAYVRNRAEGIYFISGERGKIDPEFNITEPRPEESTPSWIGFKGEHLIEILSRCFTREPEKAEKIQKWAGRFQLPNIRAGYVGKRTLESNFKDNFLNIILNSTLAGLGSRQILSIIVQIFWSKSGDVIMIEEPEISLHPQNQVLLHELFSEAISQGKQIICSTHSPFFVLALSKIIKKKLLTLDDIAVHHVVKDKNGTHAEALELDKHGFVVSGIPSFMKVENDLFRDWSESLEEE